MQAKFNSTLDKEKLAVLNSKRSVFKNAFNQELKKIGYIALSGYNLEREVDKLFNSYIKNKGSGEIYFIDAKKQKITVSLKDISQNILELKAFK